MWPHNESSLMIFRAWFTSHLEAKYKQKQSSLCSLLPDIDMCHLLGLGATVLLFALGLLFTALWRRYFSESYYYLEDKSADAGKSGQLFVDIRQLTSYRENITTGLGRRKRQTESCHPSRHLPEPRGQPSLRGERR